MCVEGAGTRAVLSQARVTLARSLSSLRLLPHFKMRIIAALPVSWVFSENCLGSWKGRNFDDHRDPQKMRGIVVEGMELDLSARLEVGQSSGPQLMVCKVPGLKALWLAEPCLHLALSSSLVRGHMYICKNSAPLSVISVPRQAYLHCILSRGRFSWRYISI